MKIRVLIVEDVDSMREHLAELLSACSWVSGVRKAATTWEARLEVTRHRPDLILLDEVIPGESSVDFLAEVPAELPVVLASSFGAENAEALTGRVLGRLEKPEDSDSEAAWASFVGRLEQLVTPSEGS